MFSLSQVDPQHLNHDIHARLIDIRRPVYAVGFGALIVTDYAPGNTWCIEVSTVNADGTTTPVAWLTLDEVFIIEAGDMVIVRDDDGHEYAGTVIVADGVNVQASFQIGQRTHCRRKFVYAYIVQVIPAATRTARESNVA